MLCVNVIVLNTVVWAYKDNCVVIACTLGDVTNEKRWRYKLPACTVPVPGARKSLTVLSCREIRLSNVVRPQAVKRPIIPNAK